MTEQQAIIALYRRFFSGIQLAAPRYTMRGWPWQMDLLTVTKSGYVTEFEVKVSRGDFKVDAKKAHEKWLGWDVDGHTSRTERMVKHELLAARDTRGPSRFYYAVPQGLVTVDEVPSWAGLIEISEGRYGVGWPTITRQAPKLHDQKAPDGLANDIRRILTYRFWHLVTSDHQKLDITPEGASV